jgi:hypothetical protein
MELIATIINFPTYPGFKRVLDVDAPPPAKRARVSVDGAGTSSDCDPLTLQLRAEKMLKQEHADFLLAQALQKELNDSAKVDRRKGTERAYPLRKSGCAATARQTTLTETFGEFSLPWRNDERN